MDKINFQNKKLPAVNATNLNQLQENIDNAKYEKTGGLIDGECIVADISSKNIYLTKLYQLDKNYRTSGKIKVLPNTTYIFSSKDNNVNFVGNLQFFKNSTQESPTSQVFTFNNAFTTPENCNYIVTVFANANCPLDAKIQLEKGTVATEYCEPVNINNQVINVYQLEQKSKYRQVQIGKIGTFTGSEIGANKITFAATKYGNSSYKIEINNLPCGEYGVTVLNPMLFSCFAIEE